MQLTVLFAAFVLLLPARLEAFQETRPAVKEKEWKVAVFQNDLAAERKELAALRLLVVADRKFAEAKERLLQLEARLNDPVCVDCAILRRDVRALLDEVRRALGEKIVSSSERIDKAARRAIAENDWEFIENLGVAAVPALREAVLATPDFLPSEVKIDPFYKLLTIDPVAASELCDELASQSGFFWRRRIVRALSQVGGFRFTNVKAACPVSAVPGLVRQYEAMLSDAATRGEALGLLGTLVSGEGVTPGVLAVLREQLTSADEIVREGAWQADFRDALRPVLLELLRSPDEDLRVRAAYRLAWFDTREPEFFALAGDPSAAVRRAVASKLADEFSGTPEEARALEFLLVDPNEAVRKEARQTFYNRRIPTKTFLVSSEMKLSRDQFVTQFTADTLAKLAASEDVEDRRVFVQYLVGHVPAESVRALLIRIPADTDLGVAERCVNALQYWFEAPEECLRMAEVALSNPELGSRAVSNVASMVRSMTYWPATRLGAMRWALSRPEPELVKACGLDSLDSLDYEGIPPELLNLYCRRLFELDWASVDRICRKDASSLNAGQVAGLLELALDENAPVRLRAYALRPALRRGLRDGRTDAAVRALCADPRLGSEELIDLPAMLEAIPGPLRNECLLNLARLPDTPPRLSQALRDIDATVPGAADILVGVLETSFGQEGKRSELANQALVVMARNPSLVRREWLERGAREARHQSAALGAIEMLREPSYLPLLDELVRGGDATTVTKVIATLTAYLSNEAGELLLVAATKVSGEPREQALSHLAKIREYQAAREEWATRKTSAATRAEVVAELVAKLDAKSEEVKVQAIRALATWEAVEVMPRLIELTQSGSKSVAAAARAALERLNAPKETTGG